MFDFRFQMNLFSLGCSEHYLTTFGKRIYDDLWQKKIMASVFCKNAQKYIKLYAYLHPDVNQYQ